MTDNKMPETIYVDKHDGELYFSGDGAVEYIRSDTAYPVTKEAARKALDEFERLVKFAEANGHVSKHDKAIIETIRALLEAASK